MLSEANLTNGKGECRGKGRTAANRKMMDIALIRTWAFVALVYMYTSVSVHFELTP